MQTVTEWGAAVLTSLTAALAMVFAFIPKLIGFLIILLIGWLIATALQKAITFLLKKIGFDRMSDRIGLTRLEQRMNMPMDAAGLLGKIVFWFILLVFLVPAVDALGLGAVSTLLQQVIAYIPNVFVAILILFLGTLFATFVADIVRGITSSSNVGNPNVFANIARYAILGFVAIMALTQLQIAPALMQTLFTAIVGALALAFGLAFGLGGREAAQRWLARGESQLTTAAAQVKAQQTINEARVATDTYRQNPETNAATDTYRQDNKVNTTADTYRQDQASDRDYTSTPNDEPTQHFPQR